MQFSHIVTFYYINRELLFIMDRISYKTNFIYVVILYKLYNICYVYNFELLNLAL